MEFFNWRSFALIGVSEIAQGVEVVIGFEQLLALYAEYFRDAEGLKGNARIEPQAVVKFAGRMEIPLGNHTA